jgi:hypothetical protein
VKIPTNPGGPPAIPPDGPLDNGGQARDTALARRTTAAKSSFPTNRPAGEPAASESGRLSVPAHWQRSSLDHSQSLETMMRASVNQLVSTSPVAARLTESQRAHLEAHLAADPVVRDLLTQHLEQSLV